MTTAEQIRKTIEQAIGKDVDCVSAIVVRSANIGFMITVAADEKERGLRLKEQCEKALSKLPGVEKISIVVTSEFTATPSSGAVPKAKPAQWNLTPVEGVSKIIAVASGKGGVGKSTTTVNLAHALRALGKTVGILDADIYGPSIPHMLGLPDVKPEIVDNKMQPALAYGIKIMSMALIVGEEAAILRGPMISKSLAQMLRFTNWEQLDFLLVDMPPGTGDIHLSLAQQAPLSGAIIVTTPQPVAVIDAAKCLKTFLKLNVAIAGIVENMSGEIFGSGGGEELAAEFGVNFLGRIPLDQAIREASDNGKANNSKANNDKANNGKYLNNDIADLYSQIAKAITKNIIS